MVTILTGIAGCGDYQKVLKSTDPELKWTRAQEYFQDDRCMQAMPLLQELIGLFRGTQRMEDVYYMYAEANLCIEDWYMARYTMRNFAKTFPNSDRTEEAEYQAALCSYRLSPSPTSTRATPARRWTTSSSTWTATRSRTDGTPATP